MQLELRARLCGYKLVYTFFIFGHVGENEWENHVSPGRDECICDAVMLTAT